MTLWSLPRDFGGQRSAKTHGRWSECHFLITGHDCFCTKPFNTWYLLSLHLWYVRGRKQHSGSILDPQWLTWFIPTPHPNPPRGEANWLTRVYMKKLLYLMKKISLWHPEVANWIFWKKKKKFTQGSHLTRKTVKHRNWVIKTGWQE